MLNVNESQLDRDYRQVRRVAYWLNIYSDLLVTVVRYAPAQCLEVAIWNGSKMVKLEQWVYGANNAIAILERWQAMAEEGIEIQ